MKHYYFVFPIALLSTLIVSCSSKDTTRHDAAVELREKIDSKMSSKQYDEALELIDSLNNAYPEEIELRKDLARLTAKAREGHILARIPVVEIEMTRFKNKIDSLQQLFTLVQPSKSLPGYMIDKATASRSFLSGPCIQARVNTGQDAVDTPWTLAINCGRDIGLNNINFTTSDGGSFTSPVNVVQGEVATLAPESVNNLAKHVAENPGVTIKSVTLTGSKGKVNVPMRDADSEAIGRAWQLADLNTQLRHSLIEREKLERQLQLVRDQAANL